MIARDQQEIGTTRRGKIAPAMPICAARDSQPLAMGEIGLLLLLTSP